MAQEHVITFRASDELKTAISDAAAADFRTSSSLITKILNEWLREHHQATGDDPAPVVKHVPRGRPRLRPKADGQHPWHGMIENWLGDRERVTVDEALEGAMKIDPKTAQTGQRKAVENVLSDLGWRKRTERQVGSPDLLIWVRL